jgi:hypothetical protein
MLTSLLLVSELKLKVKQVKGFGLADTVHGTKINKNGKEMLSFHIGLDVFSLFEVRVIQCL